MRSHIDLGGEFSCLMHGATISVSRFVRHLSWFASLHQLAEDPAWQSLTSLALRLDKTSFLAISAYEFRLL